MNENLPADFLRILSEVTAKRPRTVVQHILQHGYITSEELKDTYGYNHPPRAIRDVRELGIPIVTYRVTDASGRSIAAYKFGDPATMVALPIKAQGRSPLSKKLKEELIKKYGTRCFIYLQEMAPELLQVDHRIPYEIGGEKDIGEISNFMLLSPSANRAKSWACEHCANWNTKDEAMCQTCFWAYPEKYEHIAGRAARVVTLMFSGKEELEDFKVFAQLYRTPEELQHEIHLLIRQHIHKVIKTPGR